jgi:hypothetical protein
VENRLEGGKIGSKQLGGHFESPGKDGAGSDYGTMWTVRHLLKIRAGMTPVFREWLNFA